MNNKRLLGIFGIVGILLALNACYYDEVLPAEDSTENLGPQSFSADIIPIFNADCNASGCHNAGGQKPDLSAANAYLSLVSGGYIDTTTPENSSLYKWMRGDLGTPMPVSGTNATYNSKVLAWIQQGALNN